VRWQFHTAYQGGPLSYYSGDQATLPVNVPLARDVPVERTPAQIGSTFSVELRALQGLYTLSATGERQRTTVAITIEQDYGGGWFNVIYGLQGVELIYNGDSGPTAAGAVQIGAVMVVGVYRDTNALRVRCAIQPQMGNAIHMREEGGKFFSQITSASGPEDEGPGEDGRRQYLLHVDALPPADVTNALETNYALLGLFDRVPTPAQLGTWSAEMRDGVLYVTGAVMSTQALAVTWPLPPDLPEGSYPVRVQVHTEVFAPPSASNRITWTTLRTVKNQAPVRPSSPRGLLEMRISASEDIQGAIETISALVMSRVRDWTGALVHSRNPGWAYLDLLTGPANSRPVPWDQIDLARIGAWMAWCEAAAPQGDYRAHCDLIASERATVGELAQVICATGRAIPVIRDGKYSVIYEAEARAPVQLFNERNSTGLTATHTWPDQPHALRVRYVDENSWTRNEIVCFAPGYDGTNATRYQTLDLDGIVRGPQAWREGMYYLAQASLRRETIELKADVESLVCQRGDLVLVSHDALLGSVGARVVKVTPVPADPLPWDSPPCVMGSTTTYQGHFPDPDGGHAAVGYASTALAVTSNVQLPPVPVVAGVQYRVSIRAKRSAAGTNNGQAMRIQPPTGGVLTVPSSAVTTEWTAISLTFTPTTSGNATAYWQYNHATGNRTFIYYGGTLETYVPRYELDVSLEAAPATPTVRVRRQDGTQASYPIAQFHSLAPVVFSLAPGTAPALAPDDLVVIGTASTITSEWIVDAVMPAADLAATLRLIERAPGIVNADTGAIPPYVPPGGSGMAAPVPAVRALTLTAAAIYVDRKPFYDAALSWEAPQGAGIARYEVRENGQLIATTTKPSHAWKIDRTTLPAAGLPAGYSVMAVGVRGGRSPEATTGAVWYRETIPPPPVRFFSTNVQSETVLMTWTPYGPAELVDLDYYELRFSPDPAADFNTMPAVVDKCGPSTTSTTTHARTGRYGIVAVDTSGNISPPSYSNTIIETLPALNLVQDIAGAPGWAGTFSGTVAVGDELRLAAGGDGAFPLEGWWFSDVGAAYGAAWQFRLKAMVEAYGTAQARFMADWTPLAGADPIGEAIPIQDWNAELFVQTSTGTPVMASWTTLAAVAPLSGGGTVSPWTRLISGDFIFEVVRWGLRLTSRTGAATPSVTVGTLRVEAVERREAGSDVAIPAEGARIDFTYPFLVVPAVATTIDSGEKGDTIVRTADQHGFNIQVFATSGLGAARTIDWIAGGFGKGLSS
jgi:hypothetical protein